jgi:hypothetical protein
MDFSVEDKVDALAYNHVLWKGLMGSRLYPVRAGDAQPHRPDNDHD